jgi:hypothetical protein
MKVPGGSADIFLIINDNREKISTWNRPDLFENNNFRNPDYYEITVQTSGQTLKLN